MRLTKWGIWVGEGEDAASTGFGWLACARELIEADTCNLEKQRRRSTAILFFLLKKFLFSRFTAIFFYETVRLSLALLLVKETRALFSNTVKLRKGGGNSRLTLFDYLCRLLGFFSSKWGIVDRVGENKEHSSFISQLVRVLWGSGV